ncbi:MAG: extracellular solute-binding protein [Actinophytocola sp.]|nr:extracellular solute-binding protein [Actinophytocola sp.]
MYRTRVLTAVFAAATLVLTACAGDGASSTPADENPEPAEIRLWINGPDTPEPMRKWLKTTFEKENSGSTLIIEEQQWEGLVDRLTTSLGSESETQDVVEVGNTQAPTFTTVGAFSDLTDLMPNLGGDDLLEGFVEAGSADVDGFSGFWLPGQDWRDGAAFVWDAGGDFAVERDGKWVGALSSAESRKGLEQVSELFADASAAPRDGNEAEPEVPFCAKNVGVFALPGSDGEPAPVLLGGSNIAVSAKSPHQALAKQVVELMLSDDFQSQYAKNGLTPAKMSLAEQLGDDEFAAATIKAVSNAKLTPAAAGWASVEGARILEDLFVGIAKGGDVEKLAKQADDAITKQLDK